MKGLVIKSTGSWITVLDASGNKVECKLKGQFRMKGIRTTNPVAVGDHVEFQYVTNNNTGLITAISERHNYIIRKSTKLSKASHIIASNIDLMAVIASIEQPRTSTGFIDRLLVTAEAYHIPGVVIFNKIDLYSKASIQLCEELQEIYRKAGYDTFIVSAFTGAGIPELKAYLSGKVTLMSGHSGVGKSALINMLEPELKLRTGQISDYHSKGMHTTTFAEMFPIAGNGYIIDTPGIKEFGLIHFEKKEVAERFPEMRALLPYCRYSNCTHVHEPGCAVKEALNKGEIAPGRYHNYLSILNDENLDVVEY